MKGVHRASDHVMQGTTTNGRYLLNFKTGSFLAAVPVQPVVLKYGQVSSPPSALSSQLPV